MRTRRKDTFVVIFITIWLLANTIVSFIDIDRVWIPNTIAISIMFIVVLNKRLMKWFNTK